MGGTGAVKEETRVSREVRDTLQDKVILTFLSRLQKAQQFVKERIIIICWKALTLRAVSIQTSNQSAPQRIIIRYEMSSRRLAAPQGTRLGAPQRA